MFYYKVIHKYKLENHNEVKEIGVFDSKNKALDAIECVKNKPGFKEYQDCFFVKKVFKIFKPALVNNVYWNEGFDTYYFNRKTNELCRDEENQLMKHLGFLLTEFNFKFDKLDLGNMVGENGKLWFYGPYNCYYFYNDKICINILNLVQRQDWNIYITDVVFSDQNEIRKGVEIPSKYCYSMESFASKVKNELRVDKTIFGIRAE